METLIGFEKAADVKTFVLAGKALITLKSGVSGQHFTYSVRKKRGQEIIFVKALTGPEVYSYIGYIRNNVFTHGTKSSISADAPIVAAFSFFFQRLLGNKIHKDMSVYHHGQCGRCGRVLTNPESILSGMGPECSKK